MFDGGLHKVGVVAYDVCGNLIDAFGLYDT